MCGGRRTTEPQVNLDSMTARVHSASCSRNGFHRGGVPAPVMPTMLFLSNLMLPITGTRITIHQESSAQP